MINIFNWRSNSLECSFHILCFEIRSLNTFFVLGNCRIFFSPYSKAGANKSPLFLKGVSFFWFRLSRAVNSQEIVKAQRRKKRLFRYSVKHERADLISGQKILVLEKEKAILIIFFVFVLVIKLYTLGHFKSIILFN